MRKEALRLLLACLPAVLWVVAAPGRSYTIAGSAHYHAWLNAHERGEGQ